MLQQTHVHHLLLSVYQQSLIPRITLFSLVKCMFLMVKSLLNHTKSELSSTPLAFPLVRMYATAEFGCRRLPASKGTNPRQYSQPPVFKKNAIQCSSKNWVTAFFSPLLGYAFHAIYKYYIYIHIYICFDDLAETLDKLRMVCHQKPHFGVTCRFQILSIRCCSDRWVMGNCKSMSLAIRDVSRARWS